MFARVNKNKKAMRTSRKNRTHQRQDVQNQSTRTDPAETHRALFLNLNELKVANKLSEDEYVEKLNTIIASSNDVTLLDDIHFALFAFYLQKNDWQRLDAHLTKISPSFGFYLDHESVIDSMPTTIHARSNFDFFMKKRAHINAIFRDTQQLIQFDDTDAIQRKVTAVREWVRSKVSYYNDPVNIVQQALGTSILMLKHTISILEEESAQTVSAFCTGLLLDELTEKQDKLLRFKVILNVFEYDLSVPDDLPNDSLRQFLAILNNQRAKQGAEFADCFNQCDRILAEASLAIKVDKQNKRKHGHKCFDQATAQVANPGLVDDASNSRIALR